MKSSNLAAILRRDISFVGQVAIALVLIGFVGLAIASTFVDLIALRH